MPHLEVLPAGSDPLDAVLDYIWELPHSERDFITVVIPERSGARRSCRLHAPHDLLSQAPAPLRAGPRHHRRSTRARRDRESAEPRHATCVVPIAGVSAVSLRAVRYAETLGLRDTHALYLAYDRRTHGGCGRIGCATASRCRSRSSKRPTAISAAPLLAHLREITADPEAIAVVVMPELVVRGVDRALHNQRALYLKRLLCSSRTLSFASVPYPLL